MPPCGVIGQEFVGFSLGKYPISFPADGDALLPSCGVAYKHTFIFMQSMLHVASLVHTEKAKMIVYCCFLRFGACACIQGTPESQNNRE